MSSYTGKLPLLCLLAPALGFAQIYRCDTPQGTTFSDFPCSQAATVVELQEDSAGLGGGPSEEVRKYLAEKREERAKERADDRLQASPAPVVQPDPNRENPTWQYWPRPIQQPTQRPKPERPEASQQPEYETPPAHSLRPPNDGL